MRIIYGGAREGAAAIEHPPVDEVHITGSIYSHDAIVWGPTPEERERRKRENDPLLKKPITSELGNVSPWIIVPGTYSDKQLRFQAENVAASITNNASFNCIATKMIVTWKDWPQRQRFLDAVEAVLAKVPPRKAYYPGARDRFSRLPASSRPRRATRCPGRWCAMPTRRSPSICSAKSRSSACAPKGARRQRRARLSGACRRVRQRQAVGNAQRGHDRAARFQPSAAGRQSA